MRTRLVVTLALATVLVALPARAAADAPLPPQSLYQSKIMLTDASGRRYSWDAMRGRPQLVSMFYTSCTFVCPMLVDAARAVRDRLPPEERSRLGITLITLDPRRDTPAVLARTQKERDLDPAVWTLATPEPAKVRTVAGLLGVRYRELADGDFNHTTVLVLLDGDGRVVARTEDIGTRPDATFVAALRRTLSAPH